MARKEASFRFEMFFDVGNGATDRDDLGDTRRRWWNYRIDGERRIIALHDNDGR